MIRAFQVTDSRPCFYRDHIPRECLDAAFSRVQYLGSGFSLNSIFGCKSSFSIRQCFCEGERCPFDICHGAALVFMLTAEV